MRNQFKRIGISLALFLAVSIPVAALAAQRTAAKRSAQEKLYDEVELLAEAITIVQSEYVTEVEPKQLIYGALKGMVESLDRHSQFLEPEAYSEMQVETKGEFGGVGLEVTISKDGFLTVVTPIDDTPAAEGGLRPNDKIVRIDGQSTRGISLHEAVKRLRGRPNTKVTLSLFRESENRMLEVALARSVIKIRSIKGARLVADRVGYIRITEFQDNTPRDLTKALETLEQGQGGLDGLILDLRNNPGGLLDVAIEVSQAFLPKGKLIVSTRGRIKSQNLEFLSQAERPHLGYPIVVLVNGGSASASEIVAGALQDHRRGILMGTKTFGKGSVQTVIPLKDGAAVRLTTSTYYTPSGRSIHGEGLQPDVVVEEEESPAPSKEKEPRELPEEVVAPKPVGDPQVLRAIDLLKGLKVYKAVNG
ncbi:MAG: S41 family peptidase [Candidatus Omnitrophica bacterium]|nr:S41 family peptidase [Candidatus Omnitrophota bacterium]